MAQIIVTVCDKQLDVEYDTEVPNDLELEKLLDDLTQTLMGADPALHWDLDRTALYSPKLGRVLKGNETLFDVGIWNGDYLYLTQMRNRFGL